MIQLEKLLASIPDPEYRDKVGRVLGDEYVEQARFDEIATCYPGEGLADGTRGALGFVHLLHVVDGARARDRFEPFPLDDPRVKHALALYYDLEDEDWFPMDDACVCAVGETSFVVNCRRDLAIKFVLPWFCASWRLREELARYARQARDVALVTQEDVALVKGAGEGWVAMTFIPGMNTLHQVLIEQRCGKQGKPEDGGETWKTIGENLAAMRTVALGLTRCLSQLQRSRGEDGLPRTHGDLEPHNIVLENGELGRTVLVDFGPRPQDLDRTAQISVASAPQVTPVDDLYALGEILKACLVPSDPWPHRKPNESRDDAENRARAETLAQLEKIAPRVAVVLHGMDRREERALLPAVQPDYEGIGKELDDEITVFKELSYGEDDSDPLTAIRPLSFKHPGTFLDVVSQRRYARDVERAARVSPGSDWPKIESWMRWYARTWKLVLTAFVLLTLVDVLGSRVSVGIFSGSDVHSWLDYWHRWFEDAGPSTATSRHERVVHDLVVVNYRLVSLTTAGIAFAYYMNIFSTLRARAVSRKLDLMMRWGPLAAMLLQLACMALSPSSFAWAAGIGGLFVSVNNSQWLRAMKRVTRRPGSRAPGPAEADHPSPPTRWTALQMHWNVLRGHGPRPSHPEFPEGDPRLAAFEQWPKMMYAYSIAGILIGALLALGWLEDAWFFALGLTAANIFKVFMQNCTKRAPDVRGWLSLTAYLGAQNPGDALAEQPAAAVA